MYPHGVVRDDGDGSVVALTIVDDGTGVLVLVGQAIAGRGVRFERSVLDKVTGGSYIILRWQAMRLPLSRPGR